MATVYKDASKGDFYYAQWFDHTGKRRKKCTKTTDKKAAERIAAKLEADAALRRDGVIDVRQEALMAQSRLDTEAHLKVYEAKLRAPGRSAAYVTDTMRMIRAIAAEAAFKTVSDISADGVNEYATAMHDDGEAGRTVHKYLTAIKGFTKWLTKHGKLPYDPLATVEKPNPDADRRRERRFLLPDEWQWLKRITLANGESYGMAPQERVLLYETSIQTGLRSSELRSLSGARLFIEGTRPYVTVKARSTKNKQDARQYIRQPLAKALKAHISGQPGRAPVFNLPDRTQMAKMLRGDLAAARKAWLDEATDLKERHRRDQGDFLLEQNHGGEYLDFHSLRHTCGAWLAKAGVYPTVVQKIMRHSVITLTMDTYGHLFPGDEAEAVDRLGALLEGVEKLPFEGVDGGAAEGAVSTRNDAKLGKIERSNAKNTITESLTEVA
jgi:integrase